ncbi:MAG: ligase-associated DNA damage response endonuclease PdeM [Cyanobacteria bacterium J06642_9]
MGFPNGTPAILAVSPDQHPFLMQAIQIQTVNLNLLPQKAIYLPTHNSLLVSDVHLGKAETFQSFGIPIANPINQHTLDRLNALCHTWQPEHLFILGDLFHAKQGLVDEVIDSWLRFLNDVQLQAHLLLGNHDRPMSDDLQQLSIDCCTSPIQLADDLVLSHEPHAYGSSLNICGHVHPCVNLKTRLDQLRLPCFFHEVGINRLTLPAFGEFTGGYTVRLGREDVAYAIAEESIIPFEGTRSSQSAC